MHRDRNRILDRRTFGARLLGAAALFGMRSVGGSVLTSASFPLGTATDAYGRLRGYDKLYVADSSLIPRGIVANPALTVAALAERNIERIIAEDFRV